MSDPADTIEPESQRLRRIDTHLRKLQKLLLQQRQSLTAALTNEVSSANSELCDFELEAQLNLLLSEDDPHYAEDADNILTTLDGLIDPADSEREIDEQNFCDLPGHLMPHQGWLSHDAMAHQHGTDNPAIGSDGLLRAGKVWVDVIVRRQYLLNLKTGQFEKMR